ncbi:PKD-like domain-containing protein [uncultured Tenacibaculum sp.]|uniref:PKD-like domain-containing protein n=1 Tax=uncultured Tenacibaculum sp. TaxID=174713 RepID=UPI0026307779|nr:PKD-like domain-containing protein [uncultured Tenacibaculum sp.]
MFDYQKLNTSYCGLTLDSVSESNETSYLQNQPININYKNFVMLKIVFQLLNKNTLLSIMFFIFLSSFHIGYSQLDSQHYLPPLKQTSGTNNNANHNSSAAIQQQSIYLSTPETTGFVVNVYRGTSATPWLTIPSLSKGSPFVIDNVNDSAGAFVDQVLANSNNNITLVNNGNTGVVLTTAGLRFEAPGGEKFYVNYRGRSSAQAGSLTCKGSKALGKEFRWGGIANRHSNANSSTSLGIMATAPNTTVTISGFNPDCAFRSGTDPDGITSDVIVIPNMQPGETYVLEAVRNQGGVNATINAANVDGWLGAKIESTEPIAIANGGLNFGISSTSQARDVGIDQPVPINVIGREYVFIRGAGDGNDGTEFPVIVATQDDTDVFVGNTLIGNIDDGEYLEIPGSNYSGNTPGSNMYVRTSKDAYAFQCLAGQTNRIQTVGMNFIAPVNCLLPNSLEEIPQIQDIANTNSNISALTIVASTLINDADIQIFQNNVQITTPTPTLVNDGTGSPQWKTFYVPGLSGEISVITPGPIAVGTFMALGSNAGLAGYFSGFDTVPVVEVEITGGGCHPGSNLQEVTGGFANYAWYKGFDEISGTLLASGPTLQTYDPTLNGVGNYFVRVTDFGGCEYNSAVVTFFSCDPELQVTKVDDVDPIDAGSNVTFTITAESFSVDPITNVVIEDVLPAELEFVSANPEPGTTFSSTGPLTWNIGGMDPGDKFELEIVARARDDASGTVTNTITYNYTEIAGEVNNLPDDLSESVTINPCNTASAPSSTPVLCVNTPLTNITHNTTIATGIGTPIGLPTGVTANWSGNVITISGTPTSSGVFNYDIPLTGGCNTVSATGTITVNALPIANAITGPTEVCVNSTVDLTEGTTGTITWNSSDTGVATVNASGIVTGLAAGTTDITYTVTDANGCTSLPSAAYSITVNPLPVLSTLTSNSPVCEGENAEFTITGTANAEVTYNINGNSNQTLLLNGSGSATLTETSVTSDVTINLVSIENSTTNCVVNLTNTTTVTVNPSPTLASVSDIIVCDDMSGTQSLNANDAITLNPNTNVVWYDAAIGGNIVASPIVNTTSPSTDPPTSFFAEITDTSTSCVNSVREEVKLQIVAPPFPDLVESACSNETLNIGLSFATTYTVSSDDSINVPPGADRTTSTVGNITDTYVNTTGVSVNITYAVTIADGSACNGETFNIVVTINPEPTNTIAPTDTVCSGITLNHDLSSDVNISGSSFTWTATDNPNVIGETVSGGSGNIINDTLVNISGSTQTVTYTIIPTSSSSCQGASFTYTVTLKPEISIISQPLASQTICVGATPTDLSVTVTGGIDGLTYQWQSSTTSGGTFADISGANSSIYTPVTTSSGTTYYRVIIGDASGICTDLTSNESEVITNADPTITSQPLASQTLCVGATPTDLSVTATGGVNGLTYQWQSSAISGGTFTDISGANSSTYTPVTTSSGTTYYRVIISDTGSGCNSVTSNESEVIINADPTITSQPLGSQILCVGATPTDLSVTANGGVDGLTYQWQSSAISGGTFTDISGANSSSYTPVTTSSGTIYYRVVISDTGSGCNSVTSNESEVIINADPTIASQPLASQILCVGATPTDLSVTANGGVDGLTYQWQISAISGGTFTDISGANSSSYTPVTTSSGTIYYRVVISDTGSGCNSVTSNESEVIINVDPTITSQPLASQTLCVGATPTDLSVTATGGVNGLTYQWQSSATSGGTFADISGANSSTYTPVTTSSGTTYYRVVISDTGSGCNSVTSNESEVIINVDPTITSQPLASQTICVGATPTDLSVTANGGVDGLTYQWQSSATSGGTFADISGANSSTYTPVTTSSGTTYYRVVISDTGSGCNSVTSNESEVIINADPTITSQPLASQTLCVGATPSDLSVTASGGVDGLTYQWQSSATSGGTFTDISGANSSTYTPVTSSSGTTYYRVVINDTGSGCNSATSNESEVIINADPTITSQPLVSQTICVGATPTDLSVTANGGVDGLTYQWQSSATSGGTFIDISGANSSSYTPVTTSSGTTYYRVVISDTGSGCNSVTSNESEVVINVDPTITSQPLASQTLCVGAALTDLSVTASGGVNGLTYQWQSSASSGGTFTDISGANSSTYTPVTSSSGTTYYRVVINDTGSGCNSATSNESEVIINADPTITSQPLASQTLCVGATPTDLSVTANGGVDGLTYQWQSSATSGGTFTDISGANSSTYTPVTTSSGTTYYRVVISDTGSGCNSVTSNESEVIINADPTITSQPLASQTICVGATPTDLSVTASGGVNGLIYQWQSSATSGGTFIDISGANSSTYTPVTTSSGTTYYRVILSDTGSGCNSVTSNESEVIINADPTITSQPLTSQTLCVGATPTDLSVTANGGVDGLTYQWQSSATSGGTFADISGANSSSYTPVTTSSGTTYYRVVISDTGSGCNSVTSNESEVIINADPTITSQPLTIQTLCVGATPTDLSVTANGGVNGLAYQWQSSATSGGTFADISGANSSTYTPVTTASGTTYYRVVISDTGSGCNSVTSNESEVIINADPTITSQPLTSQTLCVGATPTDVSITASGGVNGLTYQWQSSATSGGTFADISGANSSTYTPVTTASGTTYYRVIISDTGSGCNSVTSNESEVIINADPTITSQPLVSQTICVGATPTDLSIIASGGVDGLTYQWQSSATSGGTFADISGANSSTYTPVTSSSGTTYYRVVISDTGSGCNSVTSNESEVVINVDPTITSQPLSSQTLCVGATPTDLSVTANGGVDGLTYQWQSSATSGGTFADISGANSSTYTPVTSSSGTTYYRVVINDTGSGCNSATSNESEVIIKADPTITSQPLSSQTLCVGATPTDLSITATGGVDGLTYQWQSSATSGGTFTDISGANSSSYTPVTTSSGTTYYRVVISDTGSGCNSVTSNESEVIINADPTITSQPLASQTLCVGATPTDLSVTANGGVDGLTYQWQSSATSGGTFTDISGANSSTYTPVTTSSGTTYYRVVISDTGSGCNSVTSNESEVIINADPTITSQPLTSQTLCVGATPTDLSVTASGGVNGLTYQWQSSATSGGTFADISGANSSSYTPVTTSSGTTYYRVVINDTGSGCNSVTSNESEVIINADPTITSQPLASQTLCVGAAPTDLSVTASGGVNGLTYQWQSSATSGGTFADISGANSSSYTPVTTSSGTTYYRVVISDTGSGCNSITSNESEVIINADPTITSQPLSSQTLCVGATPTDLSVTATGGVDGLTYQWQISATSGGTFTDISGANSSSYTPVTTSSGTTYYRVVISDTGSGCNSITSNESEVIINADPTITSQPLASQTLCVGATPTDLSVTATGGVDGLTYQWQISATSGGTFTDISGANSSSYTPVTTSSGTTYYRVVISDTGSGCNSVTSNESEVIINADPTITSQPLVSQTICVGATPTDLSVTATGGVDGLTYQWQSSATSGGTFADISGANSSTYTPVTSSSGTTYYRVVISDTGSGCNSVTSNESEVIINADPTITSQPLASQTLCVGATPTDLSVTANGGVNGLTYQWQSSATSGGTFTDISGANSSSYTPVTTSSGTMYYRVVISDTGSGCNSVTSNESEVIINVDPTITGQPLASQTICVGATPTDLSVTANGGVNGLTYQWQSSATSRGTFTDISGANSSSYTPVTTASGTTYYRVVISDTGSGCNSVTSNESEVIINELPVFISLSNNSPICEGDTAEFTITGSANSILTYNLNGNGNQTVTLDSSGSTTISSFGATSDVTINLISLEFSSTSCSINLTNSETITVHPNPTLTTVSDIIECIESPIQTLNANDGITFGANISVVWYDAPTGGNIITNPTTNTENVPVSYYAELTDTTTSCVNPVREEVRLHIISPPFPNFVERVCSRENLNIAINSFTAIYTVSSSDPTNVPPASNRTIAAAANITDSYMNTTGTPVTITYTVTIDDGTACDGETFDVIVTVDPEPFNSSSPADIICSDTILNHDLTSDVNTSGNTFSWFAIDNPNVTGETISGGTASSITDMLVNTSGVVQTVEYTITPTSSEGCSGASYTYTVTVNPKPFVATLPTEISCSNLALNHNLTSDVNIAGTTFSWSAIDNPNITGETLSSSTDSSITDTLINISGTIQTVTYSIIPTSPLGCIGDLYTYTVTVNPEPFNAVLPVSVVCSKSTLNHDLSGDVNLSGVSFNWIASDNPNVTGETTTNSASGIISDTLINTSGSVQTVIYTITPTSTDGCLGTSFTYTVTVNPEPFNAIEPASIVCSNETLNHDLSGDVNLSGVSFNWVATNNPNVTGETVTNSNSASITDTLINTSGSVQTVIYTITPTSSSGCIGNSYTYTVTINPEPFNVSPSTDIICSDEVLNHDLNGDVNLSGATFSWIAADNGFVTGETTTVSNTATITDILTNTSGSVQTVVYTVTPTSGNGCVGQPFRYTVTVNPEPNNNTLPTDTICSSTMLNHNLSTDVNLSGTTFNWIASDNPNVTGETLTNTTTTSITDTLVNVSGSVQTVIYSITPISAIGCVGDTFTYTVTVNPEPVLTSLTTNSPVCEGDIAEFNISGSANSVLTYNVNGNANQTVTLDATGNTTISVSNTTSDTTVNLISLSYNSTTCTVNLTNSETVIVNPNPILTTVTDIIECVQSPVQTLNANNGITFGSNISVVWYDAPTGGNIVTNPITNTVNAPISFYAEITDTTSSCVNPVREEVRLHIVSPPFPNFIEQVCSKEELNIAINSFTATYTVVSSDPANVPAASNRTVPGATNITDTYINTTGSPVTITYTVTINDGTACDGETFDVIVTVNPEPFNAIAPTDIVCSGTALNHDLTSDVNLSGSTFTWFATDNPNVTGETLSGGASTSITDTLINTSGSDQTVIYTITPIGLNGCDGNSFTYTVTVRSRPEALPISGANEVCIGETINLTEGTTGASILWTSSDTSIATVDTNGVVTGITFGTVDISYIVTDANTCNSVNSPVFTITVGPAIDSDGDGLTDCEETTGIDDPTTVGVPSGTSDPTDPCSFSGTPVADINNTIWQMGDCDGDGVTNGQEIIDGTDPTDPCSFDLSSVTLTQGGDWLSADCDGDGVTNGQEISDGTNPNDPCSVNLSSITLAQTGDWLLADCDGDGVTNGQEISDGTDPNNPCSVNSSSITLTQGGDWLSADCDGDGVINGDEISDGTNPNDPCSVNSSSITLSQTDDWLLADCDGDGVTNGDEISDGTDPNNPCSVNSSSITLVQTGDWLLADCDGDGVTNGDEISDGTNPNDPCSVNPSSITLVQTGDWLLADCDGDGVTNGNEIIDGTNPNDPCSSNLSSVTLTQTGDWLLADCDGDGVTNGDEVTDGTNPNDPCSVNSSSITLTQTGIWLSADCDGDGVTNGQEITDGTDPNDPCSLNTTSVILPQGGAWLLADCDGDGVTNGQEITDGTNSNDPCSFNSTSITLAQGGIWLSADCDGDGVTNGQEITDGTDPSDPCSFVIGSVTLTQGGVWLLADCDGDGVTNGQEVSDGTDSNDPCSFVISSITLTQSGAWLLADCDGDGVTNGDEVSDGTDPNDPCSVNQSSITLTQSGAWLLADCDGDGVTNGDEVSDGTDPNDPCSVNQSSITLTQSGAWLLADCDGDGVTNGDEVSDGTDPNDPCSSNLSSITLTQSGAWLSADCDGDGVTNEDEVTDGTDPNDPCSYDASNQDILIVTPNWLALDCDNDGLTNEDEIDASTDPLNPDSDGDGLTDGEEVTGVDDPNTPFDPTSFTDGPTSNPNDPCDPIEGANCDNDECLNPYNLMSPGDGNTNNSVFFIKCIDNPEYANNTVEIFNRWGNTVFKIKGYSNTDSSRRFEGISNGRATITVDQKLPVGTYYYVIDPGNGEKPRTGWLYINR